jgi:serpin B
MRVVTATIAGSLIAATLTLPLSGCGDSTGPQRVDSLTSLPRTLSAAELTGVASGNRFALSLLRATGTASTGNTLLSPYSVWMALGMTMNGAAGQTDTEMRSTLGWGDRPRAEINAAYKDLAALLPTLDPSVTVRSGNGIWVRSGLAVDSGFAGDVRQYFGATVKSVATPQLMFDAVNAWGSQQTDGMVPKVLDQTPPQDLQMLLANAVLFSGAWRDEFETQNTQSGAFTLESGTAIQVPMMMRKGGYRMGGTSTYQAVELPYGNSAYSFLAIVPAVGTMPALLAGLDSTFLVSVVQSLSPASAQAPIYLPRFTVRGSRELTPALTQLGMPRAFSNNAEFPRFVGGGSKLGFVQHSVALEVNEHGTRAAGVTVVGVVTTSAPPELRVNRPFVFFIRERFTGAILFAGVIRDPRTTS